MNKRLRGHEVSPAPTAQAQQLASDLRSGADLHTYQVVTNSIADMVSVVGEDEVYRLVNDAWCRQTGLARERVIGRNVSDVLPSSIRPERRRAFAECLRSQRVSVLRDVFERPDAPPQVLETTYSPFAEPVGGVRCVVLVTRDVTAEEQARQATRDGEALNRALLDAFPGYIAAIDEDARYTYINERAALLVSRAAHDVVGLRVDEVLGQERLEANLRHIALVRQGQAVITERHFPATADRARLDLEVRYVPGPTLPNGRRSYYVFGIDITDRKLAQEALTDAKEEAERANRAKSRFMSMMSHELRTPMNAILGFSQLLMSDTAHPLNTEQRQYAEEILRGGRHLLRLINDVLDLSRIESGRLPIAVAPVALLSLVEECVALMAPLASERPVTLQLADREALDCTVRADPLRLKQVLLNLLGNAIKYNRRDGQVTVQGSRADHHVEVRVADTGIGLTIDQRQRLFVAFERLGARGSGVEGTGIGLALSRQLMLAMGGEIGADSVLDVGSTFWIRMPRAVQRADRASAREQAAPPLPATAPQMQRVLYVEDNPVNALLMRAMLARLPDIHLECVEDPLRAIEVARALRPQLLLLDVELPGIDGIELLQRLRADETMRTIPAIAVSAGAMPGDIRKALDAGFAAYLIKPLELGDLLQAVRHHL
ncbi:MAG TPA: PAS domain-containing protein, partial [Burkholderiaceae bacterium]|nr:PAS domain-containing protein [Burkholderiaceae bacterium]